MDITFVKRWQL